MLARSRRRPAPEESKITAAHTHVHASSISVITVKLFSAKHGCAKRKSHANAVACRRIHDPRSSPSTNSPSNFAVPTAVSPVTPTAAIRHAVTPKSAGIA